MFLGFPFPDFAVCFCVSRWFRMANEISWAPRFYKKTGKPDLAFKDFFYMVKFHESKEIVQNFVEKKSSIDFPTCKMIPGS